MKTKTAYLIVAAAMAMAGQRLTAQTAQPPRQVHFYQKTADKPAVDEKEAKEKKEHAKYGGFLPAGFWALGGNTSTSPGMNFLGTFDDEPLEFKEAGMRGLRLEPNSYLSAILGDFNGKIMGDSPYSFIGGGAYNVCEGIYATVSGGLDNKAGANYAFGAGRRAKAMHQGAFVWGDSTDADVSSTAADQFTVRASGGVVLYTSSSLASGAMLPAGSGSWSTLSDRATKENLRTVDTAELLERISTMSFTTWNYKTQDKAIRHLGPMAQDFYVAFGIGEDDRHIATVDEAGVALAAIQGLNQKVERLQGELERKDREVEVMRIRMERLERMVSETMQHGARSGGVNVE